LPPSFADIHAGWSTTAPNVDDTDLSVFYDGWVTACNANRLVHNLYQQSVITSHWADIWRSGGATASADGTLYVNTEMPLMPMIGPRYNREYTLGIATFTSWELEIPH